MHLLYLDHSGEITDPQQVHFVVAGLCCFERQTHWLRRSLDDIAGRFNRDDPSAVELHASPMITGNHGWKIHPVAERRQAVKDALAAIRDSHATNTLFGICKDKRAANSNDLVAEAFEEMCSRFDRFLLHLHRQGNTQRGLIVFDKADYENRMQSLARIFQTQGHQWGVVRNLAEVPLFLDSRASRLLQAADLVAWAIRRKYEKGEAEFFDIIEPKFYRDATGLRGFAYFPHAPSRE